MNSPASFRPGTIAESKARTACKQLINRTGVGLELLEEDRLPLETFREINSLFLASVEGTVRPNNGRMHPLPENSELEQRLLAAIQSVSLLKEMRLLY